MNQITRDTFRWRTMEGEVLTLDQMETSHVFNCMKMAFNHLAEALGERTVWFTQRYGDYERQAIDNPIALARLIAIFASEIFRRDDLPAKYRPPFWEMIAILRGCPRVEGARGLLPAPPRNFPRSIDFRES